MRNLLNKLVGIRCHCQLVKIWIILVCLVVKKQFLATNFEYMIVALRHYLFIFNSYLYANSYLYWWDPTWIDGTQQRWDTNTRPPVLYMMHLATRHCARPTYCNIRSNAIFFWRSRRYPRYLLDVARLPLEIKSCLLAI